MLQDLISKIPSLRSELYRGSCVYSLIESQVLKDVETYFGLNSSCRVDFSGVGVIHLPYFSMGNINTTHLFGLDELVLFSYYMINKGKYKKVADIGANVGLHSVVLAKLGYIVSAYEPDPVHCREFLKNIKSNEVSGRVELFCNAVSDVVGEVAFTRVKDNTTGNHITGAKNPYGQTDEFLVRTLGFRDILLESELVKIDVEGHEAVLITCTESKDWDGTDAFLEVGSKENAKKIYEHLNNLGIPMFSQKIGWSRVRAPEDLPSHHREGSMFITKQKDMTW